MLNEFYYKLLNIHNTDNNISYKLKVIMDKFNKSFMYVDKERMCKVFSNIISRILSNDNIDNRVLNTKNEFGVYEHEIVLCRGIDENKLKYYLIDYTFSQFLSSSSYYSKISNTINKDNKFEILLKNGYVEITEHFMLNYFKIFGINLDNFDLDDYFNDLIKKHKK